MAEEKIYLSTCKPTKEGSICEVELAGVKGSVEVKGDLAKKLAEKIPIKIEIIKK